MILEIYPQYGFHISDGYMSDISSGYMEMEMEIYTSDILEKYL